MVAGRAEHSWMNQGCGNGKYPGEAPMPCPDLACIFAVRPTLVDKDRPPLQAIREAVN